MAYQVTASYFSFSPLGTRANSVALFGVVNSLSGEAEVDYVPANNTFQSNYSKTYLRKSHGKSI